MSTCLFPSTISTFLHSSLPFLCVFHILHNLRVGVMSVNVFPYVNSEKGEGGMLGTHIPLAAFTDYLLFLPFPEASSSSLAIKVTSTSFTSAQVVLRRMGGEDSYTSSSSSSPLRNVNYAVSSVVGGFEVYYRLMSSTDGEWTLVPSLLPSPDANHSVTLDDLLCGSTYLIYAVDLDTGIKTETVSFKTQGTAPVAPRREHVLRVVNDSTLLIYPSSWDHPIGCPITRLTIEYRASSQHTWTLVSSQALSDEVIELSNLLPRSLYSVRMTAHTKGSPSTMAEYEARVGLPEEYFSSENARVGSIPIDSSTLISLLSSLFVLLVGLVAVISLVGYKRRLNKRLLLKKHTRKPSATSAATTTAASSIRTEVSQSDLLLHVHRTPTAQMSRLNRDKTALPPTPVDEQPLVMKLPPHISNVVSQQQQSSSQQHVMRMGNKQDSIGMTPGKTNTGSSDGSRKGSCPFESPAVIRGRLPKVPIPRKQLEEIENDAYNEYDEITPYATFRLLDKHEDSTPVDDMKSFTVRVQGEPAYHFKVSELSCYIWSFPHWCLRVFLVVDIRRYKEKKKRGHLSSSYLFTLPHTSTQHLCLVGKRHYTVKHTHFLSERMSKMSFSDNDLQEGRLMPQCFLFCVFPLYFFFLSICVISSNLYLTSTLLVLSTLSDMTGTHTDSRCERKSSRENESTQIHKQAYRKNSFTVMTLRWISMLERRNGHRSMMGKERTKGRKKSWKNHGRTMEESHGRKKKKWRQGTTEKLQQQTNDSVTDRREKQDTQEKGIRSTFHVLKMSPEFLVPNRLITHYLEWKEKEKNTMTM